MWRKVWSVAVVITILFIYCSTIQAQKHEDRIVFISYVNGDPEIFLMEGKDGKPIQLTKQGQDDANKSSPALSPDGERVAFVSSVGMGPNIYVMDIKDCKPEQLVSGYGCPDWSPDGRRIVCTHEDDIYIMDEDGGNLTRLTEIGGVHYPQWSPDGKSILFVYQVDQMAQEQMAVLDIKSRQIMEFAGTKSPRSPCIWSSDGQRIAFVTYKSSSRPNIYVMDAGGGSVKQLTNSPNEDVYPAWSPDGSKVAFSRVDNGQADIYMMDADGNNVQQITDSPEAEMQLDWSPDGKKLVFVSADLILPTIYVIDADGNNRRRLIEGSGVYAFPDWLPSGQIGFMSYEDGSIYVVDADGGVPELVIENQRKLAMMIPTWSPDGKRIAYQIVTASGTKQGIYVSDLDGGNERLVIDVADPFDGGFLSWSPDGRKLATSRSKEGRVLVHIVDVESGDAVCIGDADTFSEQVTPAFSPDGRKIVFSAAAERDGPGYWIYVMNADGSNPRTIGSIDPVMHVEGMTWSPDSSEILFSGRVSGLPDIYRMNVQTGEVEIWQENAADPDWVDPGFSFSIDPRRKLLTTWGKIKQALTEQ